MTVSRREGNWKLTELQAIKMLFLFLQGEPFVTVRQFWFEVEGENLIFSFLPFSDIFEYKPSNNFLIEIELN